MSDIKINTNQEHIKIYDKTLQVIDSVRFEDRMNEKKQDSYQKQNAEIIYQSEEGSVKRLVRR